MEINQNLSRKKITNPKYNRFVKEDVLDDLEEKIKDIQAVTKPLLDEAVQHTRDKEWLDKAYQTLLDPAVILCVPKNVLNDVVVGHLKVEKLLETQSASKNFF